jgi:hypothetical protein
MSNAIDLAKASPDEVKKIQRSALRVLAHSVGAADELRAAEDEVITIVVVVRGTGGGRNPGSDI